MKSRIRLFVPIVTTLAALVSIGTAFGQSTGSAGSAPGNRAPNPPAPGVPNPPGYGNSGVRNPPPGYDPATGLPVNSYPNPYRNPYSINAMIDPTTGLPKRTTDVTTGMPIEDLWKAENWKDPEKKLAEVNWDGLPVSEVARFLANTFTNAFDVLLPSNWNPPSGTELRSLAEDWRNPPVTLRMRNITASEIFAAMNLLFENDNVPLRWELKVNGNRQIALLRVRDDLIPQGTPGPRQLQQVFFVGDLIGAPESGGMTMDQIVHTVSDIWNMTDNAGGKIQFHSGAQLLIANGTPEQVHLIDQTLSALRKKVELMRRPQAPIPEYPRIPAMPPNTQKSGAPQNSR